jgi:RHS repeat-associated protein
LELVRDLADAFYGRAPIYYFFLNTADGTVNVDGQSSPPLPYAFPGDVDPTVDGIDMSNPANITTNNYADCLATLRRYVEKLSWVSASVGTEDIASRSGGGGTNNCSDAIQQASDGWDSSNWSTPGFPDISLIGLDGVSWQDSSVVPTPYYTAVASTRGRLSCGIGSSPGFGSATLKVYVSATNYPAGEGANPPSFAVDGAYHLLASSSVGPGTQYTSDLLANEKPTAPAGCSTDSRGDSVPDQAVAGWHLVAALAVLGPHFTCDPDNIHCGGSGGCASCGQGGPDTPGTVSAATGSMDVRISLGPDSFGNSAGYFYLHADQPTPATFDPAGLRYSSSQHGIGFATDNGGVLASANATAYVQPTGSGYAIYFTNQNAILGPSFISSVTVSSNGTDLNHILITNIIGASGSPHVFQFEYLPASSTWQLMQGYGLRVESRSTLLTTPSNRTDTITVKTSGGGPVDQTIEQYTLYPWGLTLVQRILGAGPSAQTNTWLYYTNTPDDGGNYGQVLLWTKPGGGWERYQYDSGGRLTNRVVQFGNNDPTSLDSTNRVFQTSYDASVIISTEQLLGSEISRTYEVHLVDDSFGLEQIQTIRCATPGANITAADNLTNVVWRTTTTGLTGYPWETLAELKPDGTMRLYSYDDGGVTRTITVQSGATGASWADDLAWSPYSYSLAIVDGTQTTTTIGQWGETLSVQVQDIASGLLVDQQTWSGYDDLKRSHTITYADGTTEMAYYSDCCGLLYEVDRDSVTNTYFYDEAKRPTATLRLGILTTNLLDAANHVLKSTRIGTNGSPIIQSAAYDLAGQLIAETNALGGTTTHTRTWAGGHLVTTTNADGGTQIEAFFQDGTPQSLTGTAVAPVRYAYGTINVGGLARAYSAEIKLNASGGDSFETMTNFADALGRAYKTAFAAPAPLHPAALTYFNNLGQITNQIDPDGLSTFFAYGAKGEPTYTVLDYNQNGAIDWSGPDRINLVTNDVFQSPDIWDNAIIRRSRTWQWSEGGPLLVNEAWSTTNNSRTAQIAFGQTNETRTAFAGNGWRYVTNAAPDGSYTLATFQYGRQQSVARFDALGNQLSAVGIGYDAHGRPSTSTDVRNGTTTTVFNSADLAQNVTTPSPDGVQPGQITSTYYNQMLQPTNVLYPDNAALTTTFAPAGDARSVSGARTYPAGYAFDAQRRMTMMTNWSTFPSSGARVTSWNYDSYRGWLAGKTYDGNVAGPTYSNTPAGRLATRVWARGIGTTNLYNPAGELSFVNYSGGASNLAYGYDRRGRQTTNVQGNITIIRKFDDAGGLLSESYTGGPLDGWSVTNGYDEHVRRTNLVLLNPRGAVLTSTAYRYDSASRLLSVATGTNSATYSYVANSALIGNIFFTNGTVRRMTTTRQYDFLNRLTSVSAWPSGGSALSFSYAYNLANQRTNCTLADGQNWAYGYDSLGQVISGSKSWSDGTPVAGQQFAYSFDTIGNRLMGSSGGDALGLNLRGSSYTNNSLNQLTGRSVPGHVQVLGSAGSNATVSLWVDTNWWAPTVRKDDYFRGELAVNNSTGAVWLTITNLAVLRNGTNADYAATNAIYEFLAQTPEIFGYDVDGNTTNDGRWVFTWDAENRLTKIESRGDIPAGSRRRLEFTYDSQWRRTQKIVSAWNGTGYTPQTTNRFVYDGWNLVAILDQTNGLVSSFVWGLDASGTLRGAGGVGGLISMTVYQGANAGTYFYTYDGNFNVVALVSASTGTVRAQYEYGPFGEMVRASSQAASASPFRLSSQYQDDETGLVCYVYRYLRASAGRWLSRDPMGERGGPNLYEFAGNDAVQHSDKLGLLVWNNSPTVVISSTTVPDFMGSGHDLQFSDSDLAMTVVRLKAKFSCCGCWFRWKLCDAGVTIDYHPEVYRRNSYPDPGEEAWVLRGENDHVSDLNAWARSSGPDEAKRIEKSVRALSWWSANACGEGVRDAFRNGLAPSLHAAWDKSRSYWDESGRHNWRMPGRRP